MASTTSSNHHDNALRQAFDMYDSDNDGSIDVNDLKKTMKRLGHSLSESEIKRMMNGVDRDGDNKICFDDFVHFFEASTTRHHEQELWGAFQVFDTTKTGTISRAELFYCLRKIGMDIVEEDMDSIMKAAGCSAPGEEIDFEAFKRFMC